MESNFNKIKEAFVLLGLLLLLVNAVVLKVVNKAVIQLTEIDSECSWDDIEFYVSMDGIYCIEKNITYAYEFMDFVPLECIEFSVKEMIMSFYLLIKHYISLFIEINFWGMMECTCICETPTLDMQCDAVGNVSITT